MPITILEIPKGKLINKEAARKLCEDTGNVLHQALKVPDPEDRESRVVAADSEEVTLKTAFTVGNNEYPDFEPSAFFPSREEIFSAGEQIKKIIGEANMGISRAIIESWKDTTFILREESSTESKISIPEEELRRMGSQIEKPTIKLFLSPEKSQIGSGTKEGDPAKENEQFQQVTQEMSNFLKEKFGLPEDAITSEVIFSSFADTDFSVEFDCETSSDVLISENCRQFMAESFMRVLDGNNLTKKGSAEVWVRQGQPERTIFNVSPGQKS